MRCLQRLTVVMLAGLIALIPGLMGIETVFAAGGITYYVARGGKGDCSTGQSHQTPLGSIEAALTCATTDAPAASAHDTIRIAVGRYAERLTVNANVTLVGAGPGTVVDGMDSGTVITVDFGETVEVRHLTIQDGSGEDGGGIFNSGHLLLVDTTIRKNTAGSGGGIYSGITLTLRDSTVTNNSAEFGAGIYITNGTLSLVRSTLSKNTASDQFGDGGGIQAEYSTVTLRDSRVIRNTTSNDGGGIFADHSSVTLIESPVSDNSTGANGGGGILGAHGSLTLRTSPVTRNTTTGSGGGILILDDENVTLIKSPVTRNTATTGGGIDNNGGTVTLTNSPVEKNTPNNCSPTGSVSGCSQ